MLQRLKNTGLTCLDASRDEERTMNARHKSSIRSFSRVYGTFTWLRRRLHTYVNLTIPIVAIKLLPLTLEIKLRCERLIDLPDLLGNFKIYQTDQHFLSHLLTEFRISLVLCDNKLLFLLLFSRYDEACIECRTFGLCSYRNTGFSAVGLERKRCSSDKVVWYSRFGLVGEHVEAGLGENGIDRYRRLLPR